MLYIVTAVHNRINITRRFIEQLNRQTYKEYTLVIVDDGSTDGTSDMVSTLMPMAVILEGNGNLWWGGALHKAYKYLSKGIIRDEDIVFICNDDIDFKEDFLQIGIDTILNNPYYLVASKGIDVNTGRVVDKARGRDPVTADGIEVPFGTPTNCCATRALFMMGNVYKKIGGMHPILLPHYCSDYEYVIRAHRKGYSCISFEHLEYGTHDELSGCPKAKSFKEMFSKRYMNNPIYKFNFIIMVTPWYLLPAYCWSLLSRKRNESTDN